MIDYARVKEYNTLYNTLYLAPKNVVLKLFDIKKPNFGTRCLLKLGSNHLLMDLKQLYINIYLLLILVEIGSEDCVYIKDILTTCVARLTFIFIFIYLLHLFTIYLRTYYNYYCLHSIMLPCVQ